MDVTADDITWSSEHLANALGVSQRTIIRWARTKGGIPWVKARKAGARRFRFGDVARFVKRRYMYWEVLSPEGKARVDAFLAEVDAQATQIIEEVRKTA